MKRRCLVAVPPVIDVLVGGLLIAWKTPPNAALEAGYKPEIQRVAMPLATW